MENIEHAEVHHQAVLSSYVCKVDSTAVQPPAERGERALLRVEAVHVVALLPRRSGTSCM
jgi:hypothetical protein